MKTLPNYLITILLCACSAMVAYQSFGDEKAAKGNAAQNEGKEVVNLKFKFPDAILLSAREIKNYDMIKVVQQEYIRKKYEDYRVVYNMYLKDVNDRFIEIVELENDEGRNAQMQFDMTEVYKKLKTKGKDTKEKIEALEKQY